MCQVLYNELPAYNDKRRSSISVATLHNLQRSRSQASSRLFYHHNTFTDSSIISVSPSSSIGHAYSGMSPAPQARGSLPDALFEQ